jgi:quercetin dioxygenase-like cupin family protein
LAIITADHDPRGLEPGMLPEPLRRIALHLQVRCDVPPGRGKNCTSSRFRHVFGRSPTIVVVLPRLEIAWQCRPPNLDAARQERESIKMQPMEGEWLETTPGERFKIRTSSSDTGGAYLIFEVEADPQVGVPRHTHDNEAEHFIVVEGTLQIAVGDKTQDFPPGHSVTVSKGTPHAWCNLTDSVVRFIVIFTPGHIEGMFRAVATKQIDDVEAFARSYGTRIIGPALHPGLHPLDEWQSHRRQISKDGRTA